MMISLGTFMDVLDKRKMVNIYSMEFMDGDYVTVSFEISGSSKSQKVTGSMPVHKSKIPLLFSKDETPTAIKIQRTPKVVSTRETLSTATFKKIRRRVRCPKTNKLISSEEFKENKKKGLYDGIPTFKQIQK